jgi:hypothetical protein
LRACSSPSTSTSSPAVTADLELAGLRGKPVLLSWSMWQQGGNKRLYGDWLNRNLAYRLEATTDRDTTLDLWIRCRRHPGRTLSESTSPLAGQRSPVQTASRSIDQGQWVVSPFEEADADARVSWRPASTRAAVARLIYTWLVERPRVQKAGPQCSGSRPSRPAGCKPWNTNKQIMPPSGEWSGRAEWMRFARLIIGAAAFLADLRPAPPPAAIRACLGCHAT